MEKTLYRDSAETVYRQVLPNGLPVCVVHRPGFTKKLAYFVTDFGSISTRFRLNGRDIVSPDGIAHFLEHKMFDLPGRDVSAEFAALGASPNAFTSYDMTAYYFSCSEHFEENLKLLLEFVSTPYFTEESVRKELGIINQEIGMSLDSPDNRIFEMLAQAMYVNHPIAVSILGTKQSIAAITPQDLTDCHNAFYRPGNMVLCVIGDVSPESVCQIASSVLPQTDTVTVSRPEVWDEPMTPRVSYVSEKMDVAMPMFQLGFKCAPTGKGENAIRQEIIGDLAAEALLGQSSALYMKLYEQGLIDGSFGGGFEAISGMAMFTCGGDSTDPEKVKDAILAQAQALSDRGLEPGEFDRLRRSALGRRIRDLDSFDSTCFRVCACQFEKYDYFRFPEIYRSIRESDIIDFIRTAVTPDNCCLSVIYPTKQEA